MTNWGISESAYALVKVLVLLINWTGASSSLPPDAYLKTGTQHFHQGNLTAAAQHFRAAMQSLPSKEGGWLAAFNLGRVLYEQDRKAEAKVALERALMGARQARAPRGEVGSVFYNLGIVLEDMGDDRGAEIAYRSAGDRGIPLGWYNLGCLLKRQSVRSSANASTGDSTGAKLTSSQLRLEALQCFAQAVHLNPKLHHAWDNAGSILRQNASYEAAGRAFGHALAAAVGEAKKNARDAGGEDEHNAPEASKSVSQYFLNLAQVFARQGISPWRRPSASPAGAYSGRSGPDYGRARQCALAAEAWDPNNHVAQFMQEAYLSEAQRAGAARTEPDEAQTLEEAQWWAERSAVADDDDDGTRAVSMTAAAKSPPSRAPRGFLQRIFDQEARGASGVEEEDDDVARSSIFDAKLRGDLAYDAPEVLREAVSTLLQQQEEPGVRRHEDTRATARGRAPFQNGLDLGCGTGINGPIFRDLVGGAWFGVDVSQGMARVAWSRAVGSPGKSYDRVFEADIEDVLIRLDAEKKVKPSEAPEILRLVQSTGDVEPHDMDSVIKPSNMELDALASTTWDLITASDSLIYTGDLSAIFHAISSCLSSGGLFALSLERMDSEDGDDAGGENGWRLQGSGTYSHSKNHVLAAGREAGLQLKFYSDSHSPRLERGLPVKGHFAIFSKDK